MCSSEGLWETAWCLSAKTGYLWYDIISFILGHAIPSSWLSFFASAHLPVVAVDIVEVYWQQTTKLAKLCQSVSFVVGQYACAFVERNRHVASLKSTIENHRAAFVNAYPDHGAVLRAGDIPRFLMVMAWLVLASLLLLHFVRLCRVWMRPPEVMFFPDRSGKNVARICQQLRCARHRIWLAMFTFTDDLLSEELVFARERGVDVRVIVDDAQCMVDGAEATWLANCGVPVTTDVSGARMHHKFVVTDNKVLSGSFNWTRAASMANNENLCVLHDASIVRAFAQEFSSLWIKFNDRGGRMHGRKARHRCNTPPSHTNGGG